MPNFNADFTPHLDSDHLRQQLNLRQVVQQLWGAPQRIHNRYDVYRSRWRDDGRKPSFTVYQDHFHDYGGSGDGGDVFDFIQRELHLDFREAVDYAASFSGTVRPALHHALPRITPTPSHEPPSTSWQLLAANERDRAAQYLWSGRPDTNRVLDYLRTKRGLTDDTIRRWRLGYNPHWRKTAYHDPETGKPVWLAPGITIPVFCDEALWGLRVRCRVGNLAEWLGMSDEIGKGGEPLPKYLNLAGSKLSGSLFNGDAIQPDKPVLMVEGEFDALLAQQELGDSIAVITLGSATNYLTCQWADRLKTASQIYLTLDTDAAGQEAAEKLRKSLGLRAVTLQIPAGKDVTEYVVEQGSHLREWFNQASCPTFFANGLPDSWRSAVLTYMGGPAALLLELLTEAARHGQISSQDFTAGQVAAMQEALGFGMTTATLYRAFQEAEDLFFSKLHTHSEALSVGNFEKNTTRKGRKAEHYRLLPIATLQAALQRWGGAALYQKHHPVENETVLARPRPAMMAAMGVDETEAQGAAEALDGLLQPAYAAQSQAQIAAGRRAMKAYVRLAASLEDHHSTALPQGWPLTDTGSYRAALLRATHDPDTPRSRSQIARLLGVSTRSVETFIRRAGLENVPQPLVEHPITDAWTVEREVQMQARQRQAFPRTLVARSAEGDEVRQPYRSSEARTFAATYLRQGYAVAVQLQVANKQRISSSTPPAVPARPCAAPRRVSHWTGQDERRRRQMGYRREWLVGQLKLACRLLRWPVVEGHIIDPDTGEVLPDDPTVLLRAVLQRGERCRRE